MTRESSRTYQLLDDIPCRLASESMRSLSSFGSRSVTRSGSLSLKLASGVGALFERLHHQVQARHVVLELGLRLLRRVVEGSDGRGEQVEGSTLDLGPGRRHVGLQLLAALRVVD